MSEARVPRERTGLEAAWLLSWLASRSHGWCSTLPGHWVKVAVTGALLLGALVAWGVALIQPWARQGTAGIVPLPHLEIDLGHVPSSSAALEALCRKPVEPVRAGPLRDPFSGPCATTAPCPSPSAPERAPAAEGSPEALLEALRAFRLELTLVDPEGARWAVIDGRNYQVGDAIGGMEIVAIEEGRVKLRQGATTCVLRMD